MLKASLRNELPRKWPLNDCSPVFRGIIQRRLQLANISTRPLADSQFEIEERRDREGIKHLLSGVSRECLPPNTLEKVSILGLTDCLNEMPRNLSVLLNNLP